MGRWGALGGVSGEAESPPAKDAPVPNPGQIETPLSLHRRMICGMTEPARQLDPRSLVARIIAELEANPAAQELLWRALLSREFQGIPLRLSRIEAEIKALRTDVEQLKADVKVLKDDVKVLKDDVKVLKDDVKGLKTDVGDLKGENLEFKLERRVPMLVQRLDLRRPRVVQGPTRTTDEAYWDAVEAAWKSRIIDDRQEERLFVTDLVVRASKSDQRLVWVAVEASNRIGQRDIERVRESADALAKVFPQDVVMAAAAGYRIDEADRARARAANVDVLLANVEA